MGLFSSSYKYYAYAGSSPLFEDEDRPETVKSNIVQSVTTGGFSITSGIRFGLGTDMYARAKSMYKYAAKPDGYYFGFPETNQEIYNITQDLLRPYIEADAGGPIDFRTTGWAEFSHPAVEPFFIEKEINEKYLDGAYFPWPIGSPVDTNWSPVDTTVEIPIEDPLNPGTYLLSNNEFEVVKTGANYQVSFPYDSGDFSVAQPFNMAPYMGDDIWIVVRYRMTGGGDQYLYWAYRIGSGDNPALEADIESEQLEMNYLPIAVLMHDTVWFDESGNLEWEETLDRLLRDINLDPYEVKEDYLEQQAEDDASGDGDKSNAETWDFFIHFAVPLKTTWRGGQEYLFHFYRFLRTRFTWTTFTDYQNFLASGGEQPSSNLSVEEGVEYTGYIARFAWSYISEITVAGSFTPPGWTEPLLPNRMWSHTYKLGDSDYNYGLDLVHGAGTYSVASSQPEGQEHSYTIVTWMSNEDDEHIHVLMMGPSMEYQINTSQTPVGVGSGGYVDYQYRFVDVELWPEDPEQDSEFRWPVHIQSLKAVSAIQREGAINDALCATVFLVEKVKVKWYQKGFFKWLIIIIAVILIVLSIIFPGFIAAASLLLTSALGGGLLAFYIIYTILMFAIGFIISMAGNLIGGTWGTVFAVVGTLIVGARAGLSGAPGGMGTMTTNSAWGSAVSLINTTVPYVKGGLQIYQAFEMEKLERDMKEFYKTAREKYEELRDAWDMLGDPSGGINPLNLAYQFDRWYVESAENFFTRTLNANPGILGYDLVNNFAGIALGLPENGNDTNIIETMFYQMEQQRGAA
jgi:hypothetical protein